MKKTGPLFALSIFLAATVPVSAGHEAPLYPSYYPQEIKIEAVDPKAAASLLERTKIHAYVGGEPIFEGPAPKSVRRVESLGSFLVVRVKPAAAKDEKAACAVAATVIQAIGREGTEFNGHPYPITPFHADYLHHADLADAAKDRFLKSSAAASTGLKLKAKGSGAEKLVRERWPAGGADWDALLEEVDVARLVAAERFDINGWIGPPWQKEGWFHAYLLLASAIGDPVARERAAGFARRLQGSAASDAAERINLERDLVTLLTAGCRTVVAGYAAKREYYSAEYSEGIENIAHDSHTGLNAPIFLRTVKLKDFPWNGWLRLGVPAPPLAAWNPFGGFGDEAGRLIWWSLGDPALFPNPYGAGWVLNRIGDVRPAAGP